MESKERYLNIIKKFKDINLSSIFKSVDADNSSFYTGRYSLENMQRVTDALRERLCEFYPELENKLILDTKQKNIDFVKDICKISIINICKELSIQSCDIYALRASSAKYELLINEIKKRLKDVFVKFSK